jgi:shikimate dehydrogenase
MPRLAVLGYPVAHSRSPAMHNAALHALGLTGWRYQLLPLPPEVFTESVRALPALGFRGINVTIPHKHAALALADSASETARAVGAANTLTFTAAGIAADNTDVSGLLNALGPDCDPRARTCLVLGAGGAGRAAVHALVQAGAAEVMVWNRTPERAAELCSQLGGTPVSDAGARDARADLIVQCTSVGLHDPDETFKRLPIAADTFAAGNCVVDMVYRAGGTKFLAAARSRGASVIDGLDVLVGQGAASLTQWTGRPAPIQVMRRAVTDTNSE